jgi:hypothetical protein
MFVEEMRFEIKGDLGEVEHHPQFDLSEVVFLLNCNFLQTSDLSEVNP